MLRAFRKILVLSIFCLTLSEISMVTSPVYGAEATLTLSPTSLSIPVGQPVSTTILLNTNGESVNRVLAIINYPAELIVPQSIDTSNSFIDLWYQANIGGQTGQLILEGGISGNGTVGDQLEFAKVNFDTVSEGVATVSFSLESKIYRKSDGVNIFSDFSSAVYSITSITPTPIVTVIPNPITSPTPTPYQIVTPTPSNLPKSGSETNTLLFSLLSTVAFGVGFVIVKKT